jgi:hypothetical protein
LLCNDMRDTHADTEKNGSDFWIRPWVGLRCHVPLTKCYKEGFKHSKVYKGIGRNIDSIEIAYFWKVG